jgi:hypothetical protein
MLNRIIKPLLVLVLVLTAGLFSFASAGQIQFDVADFNKKFDVVQWLVAYDTVAWKTTDFMLANDKDDVSRLGKEWFCFQDKDKLWHAVYGKLENNKFDQVLHYISDADGKITRTSDKLDDVFVLLHARALHLAVARLSASVPPGYPAHNSYIKQNGDKTFTIWVLPAFQPNRVAVYGGEFIYTIDSAAEKVTRDDSYFQGAFRGFNVKPPREIWLNYREKDKPTLGAIFFVWYYREYFTKIFIDNSNSTSTLIKSGDGYVWTHVVKDKKNAGSD